MAGENRGSADHLSLWRALSEAPHRFDFYSALRRIECAFPHQPRLGESRRPQDDPIRLGQEPSLEFASATLTGFDIPKDGHAAVLRQSFFGALGPNGPLPLHLTEFVRDRVRNHGDRTLVRFFDMFHHRLLALFYRAWAQAQPTVSLDRGDRDRFSSYLGVLIGISERSMRGRDTVPDAAKRAYAGLLGRQSRNAEGLALILRGFFRVPVEVQPFTAHWMPLPEHLYTRLGRGDLAQLGQTAVIGSRVWDMQSRFRLVIGPVSLAQYERFLPRQPSQRRLADWVRTYTGFELKWDCRIVLKREEVPMLKLGSGGRLGWTTWLGKRLTGADADDLLVAGN